jgi:hypothetical protein
MANVRPLGESRMLVVNLGRSPQREQRGEIGFGRFSIIGFTAK